MKKIIALAIILSLLLFGCSPTNESGLSENSESESGIQTDVEQNSERSDLLNADKTDENGTMLWQQMSERVGDEDKTQFMAYESVFYNNSEFEFWVSGEGNVETCTWNTIPSMDVLEEDVKFDELAKFVLLDMTGDEQKELVLCFNAGLDEAYFVFLAEEENYYCTYLSSGMRFLDETGLYTIGDGVTVAKFIRMEFSDGITEKELASWQIESDYVKWTVNFIGTVAGESVTEEEFKQWEAQNVKDEAAWIQMYEEKEYDISINEREALNLAYDFYYEDSELKDYSVFCEVVPYSNVSKMGYVVVQYNNIDMSYEKYSADDISPEKNKIILASEGMSDDNKYYIFGLYEYVFVENGDYRLSTRDYIAVSVDGKTIIAERSDEEGNYISDPNMWNEF